MNLHTTRHSRGLTLIELMVIVAIIGITLGFGLPNLRAAIASSRLSASANNMVTALQLARSESIKQVKIAGVSIHTNRQGNPAQNQWIAFLESSTLPTSTPTAGTGQLLQSYSASNGVSVNVTSDGLDDSTPSYRSDGRLNQTTTITIDFTVVGSAEKRTLTIAPSGRVTIATTP